VAKPPKLKVFRTATGFDDAYVAAPSQKAALAAWGSKHDLFARGVAEIVDDPELIKEPLAQPGVVIRRSRGNAEEQLAALGPDLVAKRRPVSPEEPEQPPHAAKPVPRPKKVIAKKPKPDRSALDEAERSLAEVEKRHAQERAEIAQRQAELERQRKALKTKQSSEIKEMERKVDELRAKYERARVG
jgi:hypothetical protein